MAKADLLFNSLVRRILTEGKWQDPSYVRTHYKDGTSAPAIGILNVRWEFDKLDKEVPILTNKKIDPVKPIEEILWIWQKKSIVVQDLRDVGVNIWNEWEFKEGPWAGTIGPAYGFQLGKKCRNLNGEKVDQVDYLIHMLKNNPGSRRNLTTLWGIEDLDEMFLTPCVWATQWSWWDGRLHLKVFIRSNDICVGNPYNVFQYYVLHRMMAQVADLPLGTLVFDITDAHIYDRHVEDVKKQIARPIHSAPSLWIDPTIKNFYDFKPEHFRLENYVCEPFIKYEIAE